MRHHQRDEYDENSSADLQQYGAGESDRHANELRHVQPRLGDAAGPCNVGLAMAEIIPSSGEQPRRIDSPDEECGKPVPHVRVSYFAGSAPEVRIAYYRFAISKCSITSGRVSPAGSLSP